MSLSVGNKDCLLLLHDIEQLTIVYLTFFEAVNRNFAIRIWIRMDDGVNPGFRSRYSGTLAVRTPC